MLLTRLEITRNTICLVRIQFFIKTTNNFNSCIHNLGWSTILWSNRWGTFSSFISSLSTRREVATKWYIFFQLATSSLIIVNIRHFLFWLYQVEISLVFYDYFVSIVSQLSHPLMFKEDSLKYYKLKDILLYRLGLFFVPCSSYKIQLIREAHNSKVAGRFRMNKTYENLYGYLFGYG